MRSSISIPIIVGSLAVSLTASAQPSDATPPQVDLTKTSVVHRYKVLAVETAALAGLGQAWYWRHGASTNSGDWELPGNWSAIGAKFSGDALRFDGDGFDTNAIGHPIFGTASFLLAREDGFGIGGSFLYASLTSGLWETFGEWREYASINDLLLTSTSGVPLGEAIHQIVHHASRTRLDVTVGAGSHSEAAMRRSIEDISVRGELDLIPGHDGAMDNAGYITEGKRVRFALDVPFDDVGVRAEQLAVRTTLVGYYRNAVTRDTDGRLDGYRVYVGAEAGFEYRHKLDRPGEDWDLFATVGFGPATDVVLLSHGLVIDAGFDAAVQTGMIRPWAYDAWHTMNPNTFVRGSIQTNPHGYYHGFGLTIEPRLAITLRNATIGASLGKGTYRAFHGHDRYENMITADPELADDDATATAWFGVTVGRAVLRVDLATRARAGRADEVQASGSDRTALASVGVRL